MVMVRHEQGDVWLALQVFTDGPGSKRRPVLVVHDFGDQDLLVVPITSQPARTASDVLLANWKVAGLRLPSTVRTEKLGTIEKSCAERKLGTLALADLAQVRQAVETVFETILDPHA